MEGRRMKNRMKRRDLIEDERLSPHEILIEAHGEADFYDKCLLIAEVELCYDKEEVCKKSWNPEKVGSVRELVVKFIKDFAKIKSGKV